MISLNWEFIKGTWKHKAQRAQTAIKVNLFSSTNPSIQEKIAAQAEKLGKFINSPVVLNFELQ